MKITLLILLSIFAILFAAAQEDSQPPVEKEKVGQVIYGNAYESNDGQSFHYL